jgi:hypothetical protein
VAAVFATVLAIAGPPVAEGASTTYDIIFTLSAGGPAPAAGHFSYDPAVPAFSDFRVTWIGVEFDLTASANNPVIIEGNGCPGLTGPAAGFALLSHALVGCDSEAGGMVSTFSPFPRALRLTFSFSTPTKPADWSQ